MMLFSLMTAVVSFLLCIAISLALPGATTSPTTSRRQRHSGNTAPHFDNSTADVVIAPVGSTATLHCKVKNVGQQQHLSWVRTRDYHIIATGKYVYTNDERFSVLRQGRSEDWALQIRFVSLADNGTYKCQVSTSRGAVAKEVELKVVESEAEIQGPRTYHVDKGSTISLLCLIKQMPEKPEYVFWYHNEDMISFERERQGFRVEVDGERGNITSRLTIQNARSTDSGNYTCKAAHSKAASVNVFVSPGLSPLFHSNFHKLPLNFHFTRREPTFYKTDLPFSLHPYDFMHSSYIVRFSRTGIRNQRLQ
ncbi:unnamed protein product [Darwinula stevensoni]|uniref:Ig-like domain-containing protein n=1 Tax=Darwinula stevensoni TaxID=69355 RepID=A0A7R8XJA2_9CRUS|nr:unnamed protein product [Darwinula stevensoni]CAG0891993.1 unnamed protein product [Darwinula stevensoni]